MISPERLELHQRAWVRLLERYHVAPIDAYGPFDRLVAAYQEPGRAYHNLEHISEMLKIVGKLADQARDLPALQLATWYHDAVYDPRASDNEARSAEQAVADLTPLGIPAETVGRIARLILATAHGDELANEPDALILLDADLAILGADEKRYARYSQGIRQEYSWVSDEVYRKARIGVLESFLRRVRIYRTDRLHEAGDQQARANLRREVESLSSPVSNSPAASS